MGLSGLVALLGQRRLQKSRYRPVMSDAELVVVGTFLNKIDAEIAQSALEAADIESLVSADDAGGLRPTLWMSGVRLLVRSDDAERAQEILDSSR
jgi:hypothetical protein